MKNWIIGIIAVVITAGIASGIILWRNHDKNAETNQENHQATENQEPILNQSTINKGENDMTNGKTLVAYFSAQNHTKAVAEKIAAKLGADKFEIVPVEIYTEEDLDWTNDNSRVGREHGDVALREVVLENTAVPNWDTYDTVFLGYPIWWGIAAWPVDGFVQANNFEGKTVIPFCTSASSGIGESDKLLAELAGTGNWQAGRRFSSNATDGEIENWLNSL